MAKRSNEKRPGSSGPNDSLDVTVKAPLEAPVPAATGEFAPEPAPDKKKYPYPKEPKDKK